MGVGRMGADGGLVFEFIGLGVEKLFDHFCERVLGGWGDGRIEVSGSEVNDDSQGQ